MIDKMKSILAVIILVSGALYARAQTNSLWLQTTVPPTNILSPRQVCDLIETESAKLDPTGQGLKVIFHPGFDKWGKAELTFSPTSLSFYELLDAVASGYSESAKVFDDVGVIPWVQYRYAYIAIEGRCSDALTGEPITNFSVKGGSLCSPILAIQPNGYFVCGIQQKFDFSKCSTATFTQFDIMEGIKQDLTFSAPGYNPIVVTNEIFPPGEPTAGLRTYDIKLTRTDENEGEQSVPEHPPQGVP